MYVTTPLISNPYIQYVTHTLNACETTTFLSQGVSYLDSKLATITNPKLFNVCKS
jgi:hypothetical protein